MNDEMTCPQCAFELDRIRTPRTSMWECPSCKGRAVTIAILRKLFPQDIVNSIWSTARQTPATDEGRPCPTCSAPMVAIPLTIQPPNAPDPITLTLDACPRCQTVWFDHDEFQKIPLDEKPAPPPDPKAQIRERLQQLPEEKQERFLHHAYEKAKEKVPDDVDPPKRLRYGARAFFPVPVLETSPDVDTAPHRPPWATLFFLLLFLASFLLAVLFYDDATPLYYDLGFLPSHPHRLENQTLFTSFLFHKNAHHLLLNLFYFFTSSALLERAIGPLKTTLILLASHLAGLLALALAHPNSSVPYIGSTGAVSGLLIALFFFCPKHSFRIHRPFRGPQLVGAKLYNGFSFGALGFFLFWLITQLYLSNRYFHYRTPLATSGITILGGALAAALLCLLFRSRP